MHILNGNHPLRTEAHEINTLGYDWRGQPTDLVCRFGFTFSRSTKRLQLNFFRSGLEKLPNESWGLDNVIVAVDADGPGGEELLTDSNNDGAATRNSRRENPI